MPVISDRKKILLLLVIPLLLGIIDQLTKWLSPNFANQDFMLLSFGNVANEGLFLGSFKNLDPNLRIIVVSTMIGFFYLAVVVVNYLISSPVMMLRYGLSILLGGLIGNVVDRAFLGYVRDFISLSPNIFFNLSDVFIGIGILLTIFSLFRDRSTLWHPNCLRNDYFINPGFQFSLALKVSLTSFSFLLLVSFFSVSYFQVLGLPKIDTTLYLVSVVSLSGIFFLLNFLTIVILSHKIIGPVKAFEAYVYSGTAISNGKPFRPRKGDCFQELESISQQYLKYIESQKYNYPKY